MSSIEHVDFGLRHIFAIAFRLAGIEREIILTPDHEEARLGLLHPCLPLRVSVDVRPIIVEEITLNFSLAGLIEKIILVSPKIRVVAFKVGIVADMPGPSCCERKQIRPQSLFVRLAIRPKLPPRL